MRFDRGNHIVTTPSTPCGEYLQARKSRLCITYLPSVLMVPSREVEKSFSPETVLITVMHANNETGVLQPIEEIAALAKKRRIVFHTDAVQTAGKIPRRMCELGADLISISAHKFYGPKGTAALYIREGTPLDPLLTGGPHERGLRAGTENVAGIVGLSHAMALAAFIGNTSVCESSRTGSSPNCRWPGKINGASASRIEFHSSAKFRSARRRARQSGLELHYLSASRAHVLTGDRNLTYGLPDFRPSFGFYQDPLA
jgi:cysteine sulfinate desulfinase/cysteine desulfurase-like protein